MTLGRLFADVTPLRTIPPYRRLWTALAVSNIGQQMTAVAVGLQIWNLTHSSLMVGLVGLAQLVPLVGLGLYGGALSDAFDRRMVGLLTAVGMWTTSGLFLAQALLGSTSVGLLYAIIALQGAFFAVGSPARQSIIPRLVPPELLPAANALGGIAWNVAFTLGPLLAGALVAATGTVMSAYLADVVAFTILVWAMWRLPSLPPLVSDGDARPRAGWQSVREGFAFLRDKKNLTMTFYLDIVAMFFGSPRALYPAIAATWFATSTRDVAVIVGFLSAAPAVGALLASVVSGPLSRVHLQGRAIVYAILTWGVAITAFGIIRSLPLALVMLAVAGGADQVSAIFRQTILQAATPDEYRGRLQGVFTVVVAGGPRLGDVESGGVAALFGESVAVVSGGLLTVAMTLGLARAVPQFWHYDSRSPVP